MRKVIFALSVAFTLAGCDALDDAMKQALQDQPPVTLVFNPGYRMLVGGQPAPIFGQDICPPPEDTFMARLFGPGQYDGMPGCLVIEPDDTSVLVNVGLPTGLVAEEWRVERDGERTMLRRADGSLLTEAKAL